MNRLVLKDNKNFDFIFLEVKEISICQIKFFENINKNNIFMEIVSKELGINILYYKIDNSQIINIINMIIKNDIKKFKISFIYLKNHINFHFIYVTQFKYKDNLYFKSQFKFENFEKYFEKKNNHIYNKFNKKINELSNDHTLEKTPNKFWIKIINFKIANTKLSKLLSYFSIFGNIINVYYSYINSTVYWEYNKLYELNRIIKCKYLLIYNNILIKYELFNNFNTILDLINNKLIQNLPMNKNINRYNSKKIIKYNGPSSTIIISNINNNLDAFRLYKIISYFFKPLLIKILKSPNNSLIIVKFNNKDESTNVLVNLNNTWISKKIIKVAYSFNRFKI